MLPKFSATSYDFVEYQPARNFIGGEFANPSGTEKLPIMNSRYGKPISHVTMSTAADVDMAVQVAHKAFADWRHWPIRDRAHIMYIMRELMTRDLTELSWLCSHENGKTFDESKAEVLKGIECLEYGCSLPNLAAGTQLEVSRGVMCETIHEPLGVVAGVTPFNFPTMVPLWMLPQALVGGNTFVLKPSERVPLSTQRMAALFQEAGLPNGVFNIVQGDKVVVNALCDHPLVKAFGFVGSTPVAKMVYGRAAATGKRALCLGGAKNHLIVVPDADVVMSSENITASFTACAGQRCMAASVLVAVGDVEPIIAAVVEKAKKIKVGVDIGPVTSAAAFERINKYITEAEKHGAKILLDGRNPKVTEGGYWVGPTIIDGLKPSDKSACEEIFGPVISILRVKNLEQAIAIENSNPYGNACSIYTTSGHVAGEVMRRAEAGMCGVNVGVPVPREPFAFGGWNDSKFGNGDITGWEGFQFWTRARKITTKWALQKDSTWMG
jgi:malonate-semialdehyde dehydrogenase (acetylating) / methylmalonate-semialdehyde dehydrogenase